MLALLFAQPVARRLRVPLSLAPPAMAAPAAGRARRLRGHTRRARRPIRCASCIARCGASRPVDAGAATSRCRAAPLLVVARSTRRESSRYAVPVDAHRARHDGDRTAGRHPVLPPPDLTPAFAQYGAAIDGRAPRRRSRTRRLHVRVDFEVPAYSPSHCAALRCRSRARGRSAADARRSAAPRARALAAPAGAGRGRRRRARDGRRRGPVAGSGAEARRSTTCRSTAPTRGASPRTS